MPTNGIASAAEFRQLAEAQAWTEPERIVLPKSGLAVRLRRPTMMYFRLRRSRWPQELIEKLEARAVDATAGEFTPEERLLMIREDKAMIEQAFVEPKLALNPGPDEFDPNWLPAEDSAFILRYLVGEVLSDGTDLESFRRGQPGLAAVGSGDGGAVQPDPGGDARHDAPGVGD